MDVVKRAQTHRPKPLHIPKMEELMRCESCHFLCRSAAGPSNACTVKVFQSTSSTIDIQEENIARVRWTAHETILHRNDLLENGKETIIIHPLVLTKKDNVMRSAGKVERTSDTLSY
jgi:hypothetical protein